MAGNQSAGIQASYGSIQAFGNQPDGIQPGGIQSFGIQSFGIQPGGIQPSGRNQPDGNQPDGNNQPSRAGNSLQQRWYEHLCLGRLFEWFME